MRSSPKPGQSAIDEPRTRRLRQLINCRAGYAARGIAPLIMFPIPGMPFGKAAKIPCIQLTPDGQCALFGKPERPAVCANLQPRLSMCGSSRDEALAILGRLERETTPGTTDLRAGKSSRSRGTRDGRAIRSSAKRSEGWCSGGDSNPHTLRHKHLKLACLPIPPPEHSKEERGLRKKIEAL